VRAARTVVVLVGPIAVLLAVLQTDAVAANAGASVLSVTDCGSISVGPGSAGSGGKAAGALCLLRAYRSNCHPAVYSVSMFGIDTIARDSFRLVRMGGRCRIDVATSFRVVPQKPHPVASGQCSTLARRGTDVVAYGCVGKGLSASISLTGKR
jgi:hypothetical protein